MFHLYECEGHGLYWEVFYVCLDAECDCLLQPGEQVYIMTLTPETVWLEFIRDDPGVQVHTYNEWEAAS